MVDHLEIGSHRWLDKQLEEATRTGAPPNLPAVHFATGRLIDDYFVDVEDLLNNVQRWRHMPESGSTQGSINTSFAFV